MPRINTTERVLEYSTEFKVRVVKLTNELDVKAIDVANVLGLHPIMIYRWRQEFKEGKLVDKPSRRITMTKKRSAPAKKKTKVDEVTKLKKKIAELEKENDFLKKWERYLKEQRQSSSDS